MTKETVARYLENGFKGRRNVISRRELERVLKHRHIICCSKCSYFRVFTKSVRIRFYPRNI